MIYTVTARFTLRASHVRSLKEKRSIVKSLVAKVRNRFNVSCSEVEAMDSHADIVIACAVVSNTMAIAREEINRIGDFIDGNTDAELLSEEVDISNF